MALNDYFDKILCINLDRRVDKWKHCLDQFQQFGMEVERFRGHDFNEMELPEWNANAGCTNSHRGCLELICHHGWKRTLILEDDFQVVHEDMQERFSEYIQQVPPGWGMLYLGGHYAEKPLARISLNVIRIGRMLTTSSYAVTLKEARYLAPRIFGTGSIDGLYYDTHLKHDCYIFQPRLMVQRPCWSDIQHRVCDNTGPMLDTNHENMV